MARTLPLGFRPNIIYVKMDDFRVKEGFEAQAMPFLAALSGRTLHYPNAVCTIPLCAPNRGSSLTGLHAQRHGITNNGEGANTNWANTFGNALRREGVRTMLHGKFMNEWAKGSGGWGAITSLPFGFGHFEGTAGATNYFDYDTCINGINTHFGTADADYCTDVEGDSIAAQMATVRLPFCLYWGCKASHSDENELAIPAPRHASSPMTATRQARRNPERNGKQPQWVYDYFPSQWNSTELATFDTRQIAALRSVLSFSEKMDAILTALTTRGIEDSTVIFLDCDNGFAGGDHGNDQKGTLFEECINSGLRVILPAQLGLSGTRPQRVSAIDMAATICDLMGAQMPTQGHGMSFVPTFFSSTAPFRKESWVNPLKDGNGNPLVEGLRGVDYTACRAQPASVRAAGQSWCWTDVNQQLVSVPLSAQQSADMDAIKALI